MDWRDGSEDGTAWVADPEPGFHLAAWRSRDGWDWHVLDASGSRIARGWGLRSLGGAKAEAEKSYRAHRIVARRT